MMIMWKVFSQANELIGTVADGALARNKVVHVGGGIYRMEKYPEIKLRADDRFGIHLCGPASDADLAAIGVVITRAVKKISEDAALGLHRMSGTEAKPYEASRAPRRYADGIPARALR